MQIKELIRHDGLTFGAGTFFAPADDLDSYSTKYFFLSIFNANGNATITDIFLRLYTGDVYKTITINFPGGVSEFSTKSIDLANIPAAQDIQPLMCDKIQIGLTTSAPDDYNIILKLYDPYKK